MSEILEQQLAALKERLVEINDLRSASAVLNWDQATHMPAGGASARGRQLATLNRLAHQKAIDVELGHILDRLEEQNDHLSEIDAALIRVARRDFEKANKLPADFVARASSHQSESYAAWTRAKAENNFAAMIPHLRQTIQISRDYSEFFAPFQNIADPHVDNADEGMTVLEVQRIFSELRPALKTLIMEIADQPQVDASCLKGSFGANDQLAFSLSVAEKFGYNLKRGRLDTTAHPFCTRFSAGDVRITTRVREDDISDAFFSTLHEAGHALYEQGIAHELDGMPLGRGVSSGVHESQARLWENIVGRSRVFLAYWYPLLQQAFPQAYAHVSREEFYAAINKVERSLIRTDADEVTYNLHVMMRFDLEIDMLEGHLDVKDLPEAWRARMLSDIGIAPDSDREGCLQDVHWYAGYIGGCFQGYTLGNVLSAQLYAAALHSNPDIPMNIGQGDCVPLLDWLRRNIYQHGRRFGVNELIVQATGARLNVDPYLTYLREKFAKIYGVTSSTSG